MLKEVLSLVCVTVCAACVFRVLSFNHCQIDKSQFFPSVSQAQKKRGKKVERNGEQMKR